MVEQDVTSIESLIQKIYDFRAEHDSGGPSNEARHNLLSGVYLRGQGNICWKLLPSIGRKHRYGGKVLNGFDRSKEKNLLHRFRRRSYSHCNRVLNGWEALFLARHHGLPTRLLDWTTNPLVALYWACQNVEDDVDGAVWAFVRWRGETNDLNVLDTNPLKKYKYPEDIAGEEFFKFRGVKIIYPFDISVRMAAQGSVFTLHGDPNKPLEEPLPSQPSKECDIRAIRNWRVPRDLKAKMLIELNDRGINTQTLFPDIEGLAKGTWQIEVMRSGVEATECQDRV